MLKRIRRHQVRVGMYVHDLETAIVAERHQGFLLANEHDVERVKKSKLISLVIDTDRGCDVANAVERVETQPISYSREEVRHARQTIEKTRGLFEALFAEARLGAPSYRQAELAVQLLSEAVEKNPGALIGITRLKTRDEHSFLHSLGVSAIMMYFGRFLGQDDETVRLLGIGGLLHDIGKALLPQDLLSKRGRLNEDERCAIETHPQKGYDLLVGDEQIPQIVLDICLHHHEKLDGTGYPNGLAGDQISLPVRMAAICDVYEALTSRRSYKSAWSPRQAVAVMQDSPGHFDLELLSSFVLSIRDMLVPSGARKIG